MGVAWERFALARALGLSSGDLALLMLLFGILLIYAEFNRPGTILLGAVGALLFLLGVLKLLPLAISAQSIALAGSGVLLLLWGMQGKLRSWHFAAAVAGTAAIITALHSIVRLCPVHWAVATVAGFIFGLATYALGRIAVLAGRNKRLPSA